MVGWRSGFLCHVEVESKSQKRAFANKKGITQRMEGGEKMTKILSRKDCDPACYWYSELDCNPDCPIVLSLQKEEE
jgi:hypothetical protein